MKIILCLLIGLLTEFTLFSQISFYKTFSNGAYDSGEGIVQLADSSYLITGASSSFQEDQQAFIFKIDSFGNRIWTKHYGGSESDKGRRIFNVPNDGIYVAGQTNSFGNFFNVYFFKTDNLGNLIYQKNYGTPAYENIHDAVMLPDTSFILVGETENTPNETQDIYLLRINKLGDMLWTKQIGSDHNDVARSIQILNDTTVFIAGEYYVEDSLTQKAMLIKMHIDGTIEWLKTYGNFGKHVFKDINIFQDQIRAVGYNQFDLSNFDNIYQYMMRCDLDGVDDVNYSEVHDGIYSFEHITKFGSNSDDFYFSSTAENSIDLSTYNDGKDIVIFYFSGGMYFNGSLFFPSSDGDDIPNEIIPTSDGGAILVGNKNQIQNQDTKILVTKIGPNNTYLFSNTVPSVESFVSVNESFTSENSYKIYPNPVQNELVIDFDKEEEIKITILNQLGGIEREFYTNKFNVDFLRAGFYYLNLESNAGMKTFKFIKI